jgi:hypothetical protein
MKNVYRSFIVPTGKYWLTDPCYVITKSDDWLAYLKNCDEEDIANLEINAEVPRDLANAISYTLNGHYLELPNGMKVLSFSTYCGDGGYTDQLGNSYSVDSGLLGLVPYDYSPDYEPNGAGQLVEFTEDALCFTRDGILTFGTYIIDTAKDCAAFDGDEL